MAFVEPIAKDDRWVAIRRGEEITMEWARYFLHHLQWLPKGMRDLAERRNESFLVPTTNPWDFDLSYPPPQSPPPRWPEIKNLPPPDRQKIEAMRQEVHAAAQTNGMRILVLKEAPQFKECLEKHYETGGEFSRLTDRGLDCPIVWADKRFAQPIGGRWKTAVMPLPERKLEASTELKKLLREQNEKNY